MSEDITENTPPTEVNWRDQLPEDLRAAPSLANFTDIAGLAASYVNAKSLQGSSIQIPTASASAEKRANFKKRLREAAPDLIDIPEDGNDDDWNAVYTKLGAPDKLEGYELPEDLAHLAHIRDLAFESKMTKKQYKRALEKAAASDRENREGMTVARQSNRDELQTKWGVAMEPKLSRILKVAELQGAPSEFQEAIKRGDVPPSMLYFLDKVSDALSGEGSELSEQSPTQSARMTPEAVQAEIQDILDNKEYWEASSKRRPFLMKRMMELQGMVAASKKRA